MKNEDELNEQVQYQIETLKDVLKNNDYDQDGFLNDFIGHYFHLIQEIKSRNDSLLFDVLNSMNGNLNPIIFILAEFKAKVLELENYM